MGRGISFPRIAALGRISNGDVSNTHFGRSVGDNSRDDPLRNYLHHNLRPDDHSPVWHTSGGVSWTRTRRPRSGKVLTMYGRSSRRSATSATPPSPQGIAASTCARGCMASSSADAPAANGISGPSRLATTAPCTGPSNPGANAASWHVYGPCWARPVTHGAGSTGHGKPPPWVTPAWAATWGAATPPTAGQRGETAPRGGSRGWAPGRHHGWGQRPRHAGAGRHAGGQRGGASPADRGETAASLP